MSFQQNQRARLFSESKSFETLLFYCLIYREINLRTKEALILLKLKQGSALLLKEIIYNALHQENSVEIKKSNIYNAKNALKEFGVVHLTCEMAEEIQRLRLY